MFEALFACEALDILERREAGAKRTLVDFKIGDEIPRGAEFVSMYVGFPPARVFTFLVKTYEDPKTKEEKEPEVT